MAVKPFFGQLVIGPPGSGKTTYCFRTADMFKNVFNRKVAIVNLDPANENLPFLPEIDVRDSVSVEDVMELENLGPNGALMFAIEQLERDLEWLMSKISHLGDSYYFIFDCPGQIELYTHHESFQRICELLIKRFDFRLASVHLVDSYYCCDPATFISVVLSSLNTMLRMGLPHTNVLSKIDLIQKFGELDFGLEFYTDVLDLDFLVDKLEGQAFGTKFTKLSKAISGVVHESGLVSFIPVSMEDRETLYRVIKNVDKQIGYSMSDLEERRVRQTMTNAPTEGPEFDYSLLCNLEEKYIRRDITEDEPSYMND